MCLFWTMQMSESNILPTEWWLDTGALDGAGLAQAGAESNYSRAQSLATIPQIFGSAKRVFDWGVFYDLNKITLTGSVVGD